jgi:hypothetical protein
MKFEFYKEIFEKLLHSDIFKNRPVGAMRIYAQTDSQRERET